MSENQDEDCFNSMYAVNLEVQCKVVSAYEVPHHNGKGSAANGRLAYGSTGSVISHACSRLIRQSGHV
ncbi:hypothetical protein T02_15251 [Trichinella nativa]|uniref:Uncharacterized protein n=1 Tax=Trichinella nativa TaxID=6335 RepID=A0A0V1LBX8_9BILA|nr:hypothetical protein T02_15251 [Trichinella nativa]